MTDVFLYSLTKMYNCLSLFPEKHAEIEEDDFIRDAKKPERLRKAHRKPCQRTHKPFDAPGRASHGRDF